jgi:hypothetical protein
MQAIKHGTHTIADLEHSPTRRSRHQRISASNLDFCFKLTLRAERDRNVIPIHRAFLLPAIALGDICGDRDNGSPNLATEINS